jgi:hypothetical protein
MVQAVSLLAIKRPHASGAIARDASEIAAGALERLEGSGHRRKGKMSQTARGQTGQKRWTMVWNWFVNKKTGTIKIS